MKKRLRVSDLTFGVIQNVPVRLMPEGAFLRIINMVYDDDGRLTKRGGALLYNAAAIAGIMDNGVRFYRPSTAVAKTLVSNFITGRTAIYVGTDAGGTWAEVTGATNLASITSVNFCSFRDYLFIMNGVQTMQAFQSGTTKAACVFSDNSRVGKYICTNQNLVFVGGDGTAKNRIYFSADGMWTTSPVTDCSFPSANYIDCPGDESDKVTGFAVFKGRVYIFRTRNAYRIAGEESTNTISIYEVLNNAGAYDQRGICTTPDGIFFVGEDAFWFWNPEEGTLIDVGASIQDKLKTAVTTSACAAYYPLKNEIHVSFKSSSTATFNDVSVVIDFKMYHKRKIRVVESTIGASAFVSCAGVGDTGVFYNLTAATGATTKGFMYQMDYTAYTDNGVNYLIQMDTKHFTFGSPESIKTLRKLWMSMEASTDSSPISATAILDEGTIEVAMGSYTLTGFNYWGDFIYGDAYYGGGTEQSTTISGQDGLAGRKIQIRFSKTNALAFALNEFHIVYDERQARN